MVYGKEKSKSLRKVFVKTNNGTKIHWRQKQRSIEKCAVTKKPLRGIPRLTQRKFMKLNLSKRRVSRPYGGYMSHTALREMIIKNSVLNN